MVLFAVILLFVGFAILSWFGLCLMRFWHFYKYPQRLSNTLAPDDHGKQICVEGLLAPEWKSSEIHDYYRPRQHHKEDILTLEDRLVYKKVSSEHVYLIDSEGQACIRCMDKASLINISPKRTEHSNLLNAHHYSHSAKLSYKLKRGTYLTVFGLLNIHGQLEAREIFVGSRARLLHLLEFSLGLGASFALLCFGFALYFLF